jgi:hypothetical protein
MWIKDSQILNRVSFTLTFLDAETPKIRDGIVRTGGGCCGRRFDEKRVPCVS